jgi:hypothetical protein
MTGVDMPGMSAILAAFVLVKLGAADFTVFNGDNDRFAIRGVDDFVRIPKAQYKPMRMQDQTDAILWRASLRRRLLLSKETCDGPAYLPMRLKRIAML